MPQSFSITEVNDAPKNIVLNSCVTDNNGSFDKLEVINDEVNQKTDFNCMEEEADSRLV